MKKLSILFSILIITLSVNAQNIYMTKTGKIRFFSEAPLENIEAVSEKTTSIINVSTKDIACKAAIKSFVFDKPLMQEHFNEKYMESEKFPYAEFKGTIEGNADFSKDGSYEVTAKGNLTVHGVTKPMEIKGTLKVESGKISIHAVFNVKVADHEIEVPSIVVDNIAETIEVTIDAVHELYKK